jgi:predicted ester cyclase
MEEISKNLVQRMYGEAWNLGKLEVIDDLCAGDYVGIGPYGNEIGPEAVKRGVVGRRAAFPDIHVEIDEMIAAYDKVVARLTFTGTHEGEFQSIKPTHKEVTWSGIWIYRVANGKFVERWHSYDMLGILQQIGAVSGP